MKHEQKHFKLRSLHSNECKGYSPSEDSRVPSTEARRGRSSSTTVSVSSRYNWNKVATHWTFSLLDEKVLLSTSISSPIVVTVLDCGSSLRTGSCFQKLAFVCNHSIYHMSISCNYNRATAFATYFYYGYCDETRENPFVLHNRTSLPSKFLIRIMEYNHTELLLMIWHGRTKLYGE